MESKRYNPISEVDNLTSQLNLARIEALRGCTRDDSHSELPSSESPFNPICFYDVQYTEPRLSQTNRVLTKYENKEPITMDIALYNTRTHALNAEEVPGLDNLQLHKAQMERARSKVKQRYEDYIPQENSNQNVFNGDIYNPQLPISATNQPTETYKPGFVDERLGWHTNTREFRYESDIANNAYNLQRSPEIIERNRRQAEADDALFNRHQKSRWVEPKQAYRDRGYLPKYELDQFVQHDSSRYNERQVGNVDKENYNTVIRSQKLHDPESLNKIRPIVDQSFEPQFNHYQIQQGIKRFNDAKDPLSKKSHVVNEAFTPTSTKSGLFMNFASMLYTTVAESLKSIFGSEQKNPQHPTINTRSEYEDSGHRMQCQLLDNPNVYDDVFESFKEKFGYKPQHLLIMRDGSIPAIYPDEDFSNTAPVFITKDPFGNGLVKTICIFDDNKFKLIQKYQQDAIFTGDHQRVNDDYIVSEIPLTSLPAQMRERIETQNLNSKRDKTLDLTYNDFIAFSDFVVKHIETCDRVQFADIWRKIRGNKFDEEIVNAFDNRKVLVDSSAVQAANAESRKLQVRETTKNRVDKEQTALMDQDDLEIANKSPIATASLPSSGEAFRPVQQNTTPFATTRTKGANLRRFNQ